MTQAPVKIDTVMVGDIVVEKQVEAKSSYGEDDGLVLNLGDLQWQLGWNERTSQSNLSNQTISGLRQGPVSLLLISLTTYKALVLDTIYILHSLDLNYIL